MRVGILRKERRRDQVDPLVGGLRREDRRDQQLEGVAMMELGIGAGMLALEARQDLTGGRGGRGHRSLASMDGAGRGTRHGSQLLLQGGQQRRHTLQRQHDARANRRANHMVGGAGFDLLDVLLRQRLHFAERQRAIERRVRDGAEIRVRALDARGLVGHDGEVDLLPI